MAKKNTRNKSSQPQDSPDRYARLSGVGGLVSGSWGRWLLMAGLLWLLLAILYPGPMFHAGVFSSGDAGNAEAFERAGDAALAAGNYPLWNPYLFAGMPSFGSLAYVKFLYPPTAVFNFLQNQLHFGPLTWMLGHLLFGGLGMAWLLSRWRLPFGFLLLGAVIWLLFPRVVAWGVHGHGSKILAAMYLPWIVGWSLKVLDGAGRRAVGMTGLLLGLQVLSGHPQITYYTLLVTGWLGLWNTVRPFGDALRNQAAVIRWRRLGGLLLGLVLGFLIGGIMLLPVHDYSGISIRGQDTAGGGGVGLDYATGWSLAPAELGTFIMPSAAGFGKATYMGHMPFTDYPNYFGVLTLGLAFFGWSRRRGSLAAALGVMSLLAIFIAFGNLGFGFYEWLYGWLPFFNKFRIPSMILVVVAFAVAILAARGAARWKEHEDTPVPLIVLPAGLGLVGLVYLLGGGASLMKGAYLAQLGNLAAASGKQAADVLLQAAWKLHRADLIRIGLLLMTAGAACWFALRNVNFRNRGLVWTLLILVAVDLMAVDQRIIHPERELRQVGIDASGRGRLMDAQPMGRPYVRSDRNKPGPAAADLAVLVGHDRVWPLGSLGGQNVWMADGIRSLGGYHPAKLARFEPIRQRLFSEQPACRVASWLGARVVAFEGPFGDPEFGALGALGCDLDRTPLHTGGPWFYANLSALPRARLVTDWRPVTSLPEGDALAPFLDGIQSGDIDVENTVYLEATPEPQPQTADQALPAPVFVSDGMNEVVLQTRSPVAALLLLADMMAPGWRVDVDGNPADLLEADLVLRAVALPAGEHTVRFHYRDSSVRAGLTLSVLGLLLVGGLLLPSRFIPMGRFRREAKSKDRAGDE